MAAARRMLLLVLVLALLAGCGSPSTLLNPASLDRGLVIVLPGVSGRTGPSRAICRGLVASGLGYAVELRDWTSSLGPLYNQCARRRNHHKARQLAGRIVRYQDEHPGRPVVLVGHSGGTAIAAWAAEALPPGRRVDRIVMLASSLSPRYRLDRALAATRNGIVNFHSTGDNVLLGAGTRLFGTMDRKHTRGAGMLGFKSADGNGRGNTYHRLFQVPYRAEMARKGHHGGHFSAGASEFVAAYVAPLVRVERLDQQIVAAVINGETPAAASGMVALGR